MQTKTSSPANDGIGALYNRSVNSVDKLLSNDVLALVARAAIAGVFWLSGRTKVDGILSVNETALALFQDEYKLPIIPSEWAAYMAAYSEHLFPMLLVLGLFTRFSALALLGMTAVIQIFVYPGAWATHLTWAAIALYLLARGGGNVSLDRVLGIR
jgi:putative oxidoreductase